MRANSEEEEENRDLQRRERYEAEANVRGRSSEEK